MFITDVFYLWLPYNYIVLLGNLLKLCYFQRSQYRYRNSAAHAQHLPVEGLQYLCNVCNKVIGTRKGFQDHMNMHRGIYRYQCAVCQKGFASTFGLRDHMRHHTGERFTCEGCQRQFISRRGYVDHRRTCDKEVVPVSTDWCGFCHNK